MTDPPARAALGGPAPARAGRRSAARRSAPPRRARRGPRGDRGGARPPRRRAGRLGGGDPRAARRRAASRSPPGAQRHRRRAPHQPRPRPARRRRRVAAMAAVAAGYTNLEFDLATGTRGSRSDHCRALLRELTGAEDALVVNNAAGALLLALAALADGREVLISRGELIEIGGSFRIPDILARSGARLREVGTTNRTHLATTGEALGAGPARSSRCTAPTSSSAASSPRRTPAALAALADETGHALPLRRRQRAARRPLAVGSDGEPRVTDALAAGAGLVLFSGDKLLGGPQAGCLVGRRELVARCREHPLARALRADKLTLAALEATLALYQRSRVASATIPVLRMLTLRPAELEPRAAAARRAVPAGAPAGVVAGRVGGRAAAPFPGALLPTTLVALDPGPLGPDRLALRLRLGEPAVVARVAGGRVLLDPRTLPEDAFRRGPRRSPRRSRVSRRGAAVFLDRDGTLIEDAGYLRDPAAVRLLPGRPAAVAPLTSAGSAGGRGDQSVGHRARAADRGQYARHRAPAGRAARRARAPASTAHYFCPHHPDITGPCECRKPGTLLYRQAAERFGSGSARELVGGRPAARRRGRPAFGGTRASSSRHRPGRPRPAGRGGAFPVAGDLAAAVGRACSRTTAPSRCPARQPGRLPFPAHDDAGRRRRLGPRQQSRGAAARPAAGRAGAGRAGAQQPGRCRRARRARRDHGVPPRCSPIPPTPRSGSGAWSGTGSICSCSPATSSWCPPA